MSKAFIIETGRHAAGVVVSEPGGMRFHAALPLFQELDGARFATAEAAERACLDIERAADAAPVGVGKASRAAPFPASQSPGAGSSSK